MDRSAWIRLFGGPELVSDGDAITFTPIQACLVSLAYLEPRATLTREKITWLLWRLGEDAKTRHRIRQLLYNINSAGSHPVLERQGEVIVPLLASDAAELDPNDEPPLARITSAPTVDFEQWMDRAVVSLGGRQASHLAQLLDEAVIQGDLSGVEDIARRMVLLRVGGVGPVLDLAWSLQAQGRSRSASVVLETELTLRTDPVSGARLTAALKAVNRAGRLPVDSRRRGLGSARPIGRDGLLQEVWGRIVDPYGESVVLFGPPAIGRTLLLLELVRTLEARFPGGVLSAIARSGHDRSAFGLCETWLRNESVLSQLGKEIPLTTALRRAFPRLAQEIGIPPLPPEAQVSQDRLRVDFARLLTSYGSGSPPLLVSDDLDAADSPSLDLLADLLAQSSRRFRILGSVRAQNMTQAEEALSKRFSKISKFALVEVPELDRESAIDLVLQTSRRKMARAEARRIAKALGGIPGYLVEAASPEGHSTVLPEDAQQLVEARIRSLSSQERILCSCLAVSGIETPLETLSVVSGAPVSEILLAVERLMEAGLLVRGQSGFWFRQSFFATGCYSRLSRSERASLHRRFLDLGREGDPVSSASLERHVVAAGASTTEILPQLRREAEEAERRGAISEAARLWHVASGAGSNEERVAAAINGIELLIRLRRFDAADDRIRASHGLSSGHQQVLMLQAFRIESLTDPGRVSRKNAQDLLEALEMGGDDRHFATALDTALGVADFQADSDWTRRLLASADSATATSKEARTWLHLARTRHLYLGDPEVGLESARQAVQEAEGGSSSGILARALNRLIVALIFRGLLASKEGASTLRRARAIAEQYGDTLLLYDTFVNEGSWLMDIGHLDAAAEAFLTAKQIQGRDSSHLESLTMRVNRGELLLHQGDAAKAYEEFTQALLLAGPQGAGRHLCAAGLALASLELGRLRAAKEWAKEIIEIEPTARFRGNLALVALARARIAAAQRDTDQAIGTLLSFGRGMLPWMIPASLKLYLEAFRLSLRAKAPLSQQEVLRVGAVAKSLAVPGHGQQIGRLLPRLLELSAP